MTPTVEILDALAVVVRAQFEALPPMMRVEFLRQLTEGYCAACGDRILTGRVCHCEDDE